VQRTQLSSLHINEREIAKTSSATTSSAPMVM